jgi:serine/threonine-protein kinase RsbT
VGSLVTNRGGRPSLEVSGKIRTALQRYLSRISANLVLGRACSRCGIVPRNIGISHLHRLLGEIEPLLGAYLSRFEIRETLKELRALENQRSSDASAKPVAEGEPHVIEVSREDHIDAARTAALRMCRDTGLGNVDAVKVATVVSELARNICQYAGQGTITLVLLRSPRPGVRLIAADQGPGIPHLAEVVSGQWKSKTGMGLGLVGSRRLMSSFDIQAKDGNGTRITAEKYLL